MIFSSLSHIFCDYMLAIENGSQHHLSSAKPITSFSQNSHIGAIWEHTVNIKLVVGQNIDITQ